MPDITMCDKHTCKARKSCHRYTVTPNPRYQSYFADHPKENKHGSCEHFYTTNRRTS